MGHDVMAVVLAGGRGSRMGPLCEHRAKPVLPFVWQYRIMDFTLWNAIHSGIWNVAALTDYQRASVHEYLRSAAPCTVEALDPPHGSYRGTADAVYQNLDYILGQSAEVVLVLSADHVYRMDFRPMIEAHLGKGAGATVALVDVPMQDAHRFGIVATDDSGRIVEFQEKPARPRATLASMGIYAFSVDYLARLLEQDADNPYSLHDFGHSILPAAVAEGAAYGYRFDGYWRDIGTVESYHQASMEFLARPWLIRQLGVASDVAGDAVPPGDTSSIAPSATIRGVVQNSVIGPGAVVEEGALVSDSVLMELAYVGEGAVVQRAVLDTLAHVSEGASVGSQKVLAGEGSGIAVVGRGAIVPPGLRVQPARAPAAQPALA